MSKREMFKSESTLKKIHEELISHLTRESYVMIVRDAITLTIDENGSTSFWFDDLVWVILEKLKNKDPEIVDLCVKKQIGLFEITLKKFN